MSHERPRNLIQLALESAKASIEGDQAKVSALVGEVAVRSYQMGGNDRQVSESELERGDWIKVKQGTKFHHGIFVDPMDVVHATSKCGVLSTSLASFAKGRQLLLVRRPPEEDRDRVVELARSMVGRPYNVLKSNCEHLASLAHTGEATSEQLEVAGFFAILLGQVTVAALASVGERPQRG